MIIGIIEKAMKKSWFVKSLIYGYDTRASR